MPVTRRRRSFKIGATHRPLIGGDVVLKHNAKQNDLRERHDPFRDHPICEYSAIGAVSLPAKLAKPTRSVIAVLRKERCR
jgi:hypothetical protein